MRNKIDNLLLGILWLLACTLATCFWFNTLFGFDIFSSAHWHHLAQMQAIQNPIKSSFYISLILFVIIAIAGLYLLIRPRIRKIRLPVRDTHSVTPPPLTKTEPTHVPAPTAPATPISDTTTSRPPRLISTSAASTPAPHGATAPVFTPAPPAGIIPTPTIPTISPIAPQQNWQELSDIFTNAGYTVKQPPRIGTIQTALLALGTNETLWIGAVGITTTQFNTELDTLRQVFSDTLDDIEIPIKAFIIAAPDAATPGVSGILTFDTPSDLDKYISEHPNPPLSDSDTDNFEAFSTYISTVIEYLGKL